MQGCPICERELFFLSLLSLFFFFLLLKWWLLALHFGAPLCESLGICFFSGLHNLSSFSLSLSLSLSPQKVKCHFFLRGHSHKLRGKKLFFFLRLFENCRFLLLLFLGYFIFANRNRLVGYIKKLLVVGRLFWSG